MICRRQYILYWLILSIAIIPSFLHIVVATENSSTASNKTVAVTLDPMTENENRPLGAPVQLSANQMTPEQIVETKTTKTANMKATKTKTKDRTNRLKDNLSGILENIKDVGKASATIMSSFNLQGSSSGNGAGANVGGGRDSDSGSGNGSGKTIFFDNDNNNKVKQKFESFTKSTIAKFSTDIPKSDTNIKSDIQNNLNIDLNNNENSVDSVDVVENEDILVASTSVKAPISINVNNGAITKTETESVTTTQPASATTLENSKDTATKSTNNNLEFGKEEVAPALIINVRDNVQNDHLHPDGDQNKESVNKNYGSTTNSLNIESEKQVLNEVPKLVEAVNQIKECSNSNNQHLVSKQQTNAEIPNFENHNENLENSKQKPTSNVAKTVTQQQGTLATNSLPDIVTDIPAATVTDLPIDILESAQLKLDALAADTLNENQQESENKTLLNETYHSKLQNDEQVDKINDSGGKDQLNRVIDLEKAAVKSDKDEERNIPIDESKNETATPTASTTPPITTSTQSATAKTTAPTTASASSAAPPSQSSASTSTTSTVTNGSSTVTATASATATPTASDIEETQEQQQQEKENITRNLNLTAEEIPIPVFSEWAQKQMEAAEKQQQAMQQQEQSNANSSTQRRNQTNTNGKIVLHKTHAKNYAAPDCGAKIIASNADAVNTGALLSSSQDEYMLNPCGKRNWFVVELCEAIQAQKIHMANFELFSSTPKNFSVSVSNRYPTRDWSNVGRFIAEDKRELQSFDLHPHLFGKFVRVDIFSHYAKEHFCPISLFHVYGTSEFEAFETEDRPNEDLDDFDDEISQEQAGRGKYLENNLFKSASDAVISIVKKAAEVLVKPSGNKEISHDIENLCQTPLYARFNCDYCNQTLVDKINNLISCDYRKLHHLYSDSHLHHDLVNSRVCLQWFGIDIKSTLFGPNEATCSQTYIVNSSDMLDSRQSYYLNILPLDYVGALCHLTVAENTRMLQTSDYHSASHHNDESSTTQPLNLTIDKKVPDSFQINKTHERKLVTPPPVAMQPTAGTASASTNKDHHAAMADMKPTTESTPRKENEEQLVRPPVGDGSHNMPTTTPTPPSSAPSKNLSAERVDNSDVNIFNIVPDSKEAKVASITTTTESPSMTTSSEESSNEYVPSTSSSTMDSQNNGNHFEENGSWENIDNLLTSTAPTPASSTLPTSGSTGGASESHHQHTHNQNQPAPSNGVNLQQKVSSNGPQSESIFIRLSNRIKALERNMSLSGQYLEELSRRYKKQVEDLTAVLGQQMQNVRALEDQNRRHVETQFVMEQKSEHFRQEIEDLKLQIHACVLVIVFVGGLLLFFLIVAIIFYYVKYKEVLKMFNPTQALALSDHQLWPSSNVDRSDRASENSRSSSSKKPKRRKSFDSLSEQQKEKNLANKKNKSEKERRPSEEASLIIKDSISHHSIDSTSTPSSKSSGDLSRQRKISVCYANKNSPLLNSRSSPTVNIDQGHRVGVKHSWPIISQDNQYQNRIVSYLYKRDQAVDEDNFAEYVKNVPKAPLSQIAVGKNNKSKKKSNQGSQLRRLDSAPASYISIKPVPGFNLLVNEYEKTMLDDEDLINFIPNSDLAYNEFMPDGPSAFEVKSKDSADENLLPQYVQPDESSRPNKKKSRRLSSPAFFKTTFGKSLKIKGKSGSTPPHESTSWQWYHFSRKNSPNEDGVKATNSSSTTATTTSSLDSVSLSEIMFPTNCDENSFRILEEAILSSGEAKVDKPNNNQSKQKKQNKDKANISGVKLSAASIISKLSQSATNDSQNNHIQLSRDKQQQHFLKSPSSDSACSSNGPCCSNGSSTSVNKHNCNGTCSHNGSTSSGSSVSSTASSTNSSKRKILGLHKIFRKVF